MRANNIALAGTWELDKKTDEVTLDYDHRHRRRLTVTTLAGAEILLDLPEAVHIRHGDALVTEDGGYIETHAAPEALLEIRAADWAALVRLAWHLGNRHLAVQFSPAALRILDDHVIADMVTSLGGSVEKIIAPFDPESGAYAHG
ncbi:MAG: hypothetical protein B7Y73_06245 [Acidocella sp. 35-58-6]|nr:MAG: hypothetical protein B7Y73_06245 [Acidocella sp. 35-58-6]